MAQPTEKHDVEIHESLDVYNDPPNPTVDIVAIPGLGANPVKSWQWDKPSSNFNWITEKRTADDKDAGDSSKSARDGVGGLAKDCPTARVLLYNYASAYRGAYKIEQYMSNIVGILLDQLKAKREGNSRRPLVLLGHSMGGLVIAKALVVAEARRHDYPDMYEAISGCIFFGTPFDGAPVADIAKEWATINERLGKAIDSRLITLLQPGNEALKELKDDFVRSVNKLGQKIRVHCFWERKKTYWEDIIGKLAEEDFPASSLGKLALDEYRTFVSRDSATLPGMGETGLPRAHRDLVRFESDKDSSYQLVKVPLREIVNAAPRTAKARFNDARRSSIDPGTYRDIVRVFDGAEPKRKLKAIQQKLTPETWIVAGKERLFDDWLEKADRNTEYLWIHGPEGKGKSSAAAAIIEAVDERIRKREEHPDQSPQLLAYFFCEATPDYCTAEDVVKSLLQQLCLQQEILATYAMQFLKKELNHTDRPKASLSIENLWQCLQEMLSEGTVDTIYFVINNLNELEQSPSTTKLFSLIQDDIDRMSSGMAHKVRTKWLITSRSHKVMLNMLGSREVQKIDLDDAKYGNQQQQALQKYAWTKAEDLQKSKGYTMALKYLTGSVIGNRADNTKWIDVAVVQLAAFPADSSEIKVQRMLENVPQNFKLLLDGAWLSILKRDDEDMETIRELLRALVLTYEDPRGQELLVLAGLPVHSEECNAELQKLVSKCQPLVTTRTVGVDTFIGFVNADVKKHLLDHSRVLLDIGDEWTKWQHGKMSLRCFSHIMYTLGEGVQKLRSETLEADAKSEPEQGSNLIDPPRLPEIHLDEDLPSGGSKTLQEEEEGITAQPVTPSDAKPVGPRLALDYATRYWLRHASEATLDVSKIISREKLFWGPGSAQRQRWLEEYQDLTNLLTGFEFETWKALHVAASVGFPHLMTALLNEGYREEVHEDDTLFNKPLHLAAFFGNAEILEVLLHAGSPVDDKVVPGGPANTGPLAMAAHNGQIAVMKRLIVDWKANINAIDDQTGPVLNAAIVSGNTDAVKLLLEHEVRVNYGIDEVPVAPLAMSAYYSDLKMFSTILDKTKSKLTTEEFDKALIWASAAGNLDILKILLTFEHDYAAYEASLMSATAEMNWEACLLILKHPPARGLDCDDILTTAEIANEMLVEVIQACWDNSDAGLSREILDKCLYSATDKEKESAVELLLKLGASPDAKGEEFGNSLTASANDGTERILSLLLDAGANVNSPDGYALQQASSQGHVDIVRKLLSHGADVNNVSEIHPSRTALQAACNSGHDEATKLLLEKGANPNLGGGDNTRPIFGAVLYGGKVLDEMLKAPGLELDTVGGPNKGTPLATAVFNLPAGRVGQILDHGASIDFIDDDGDTALTAAAVIGDDKCLKVLLERGADFLKVTNRNKTALQIAMENGNIDCVTLLLARADFILRELQGAAEGGNEYCQSLVLSEKKGRHDAMAKETEDAKARAPAWEEPGTDISLSDDYSSEDSDDESENAHSEEDLESVPVTAKASKQSPDESLLENAEDPEVEAPAAQTPVKDDIGHELTGYPTPRSVVGDDHIEEGENTETAPGDFEAAQEHEEAKDEGEEHQVDGDTPKDNHEDEDGKEKREATDQGQTDVEANENSEDGAESAVGNGSEEGEAEPGSGDEKD